MTAPSWPDVQPDRVRIREVGPRDGLQIEPTVIPTADKVAIVNALSATGLDTIQATSAVHPRAVPQLADAEELMAGIERLPGVRYSVLVPNLRGAQRAAVMAADEWDLMLSVTDAHSRANANRGTWEAFDALVPVIALAHREGVDIVGGMATALGCPFEGRVPYTRVHEVAERYRDLGVGQLSVADTVGAADPTLVQDVMSRLRTDFPDIEFGLHLHNTRGMGLANVVAGLRAGVRIFDASVGGLGGCPYAPGASGNIATEDAVHMLKLMGVSTGVDLDAVLSIARGPMATAVGHPLESAVARAGLSWDLHPSSRKAEMPARSGEATGSHRTGASTT